MLNIKPAGLRPSPYQKPPGLFFANTPEKTGLLDEQYLYAQQNCSMADLRLSAEELKVAARRTGYKI